MPEETSARAPAGGGESGKSPLSKVHDDGADDRRQGADNERQGTRDEPQDVDDDEGVQECEDSALQEEIQWRKNSITTMTAGSESAIDPEAGRGSNNETNDAAVEVGGAAATREKRAPFNASPHSEHDGSRYRQKRSWSQ